LLSRQSGVDADHDGNREFVSVRDLQPAVLEFFESVSDNSFVSTHVLDLSTGPTFSGCLPWDVGDADADGLTDITIAGRTGNAVWFRVYESLTPTSYPTRLAWQRNGWSGAGFFEDTDFDATTEIVFVGADFSSGQYLLAIFDSIANDSYEIVHQQPIPLGFIQTTAVANDLDMDGMREVLVGTVSRVLMYESTSQNSYTQVWTGDLYASDGQPVNANVLVDAGDLDGDGQREFLVGGRKTVSEGSDPAVSLVFIFEATGDNTLEKTAHFTTPPDPEAIEAANLADLDGDGNKEVVIESGTTISAYKHLSGSWVEIWTANTVYLPARSIGASDHDQDGKDEIIVQTSSSASTVYEIDPDYAADADTDGTVDAIDNCPTVSNATQDDVDSDDVGDACDNCAQAANPDQGPAALGQTIRSANRDKFVWPNALDVVHVRGPLSGVGAYTVDLTGSLTTATQLSDATTPASGGGFYYLVRPDCAVGSWQSSVGAEPARDAALP
jgi:hypothetical protein